jgi:Ca2+-binding RTX toxin-like protein
MPATTPSTAAAVTTPCSAATATTTTTSAIAATWSARATPPPAPAARTLVYSYSQATPSAPTSRTAGSSPAPPPTSAATALNNVLYAGAGNNVIDGGAGSDTVSYYYGVSGTTGVTVSLATTAAQATGGSGTDTLTAIEHLRGSNNADKLTGNSGANRLEGYAGNDTLDGGTGNDTMLGGDGNDYYYVRDSGDVVSETNATASTGGTDTVLSYLSSYTLGANVENGRIVTSAAANLSGNSLNNYLYAGAGDNVIDGGAGSDTVTYYYGVSGTTGVIVSLATTAAQATGGSGTDTLTSIEHLRGSNNADQLTGNSGANRLEGYAGNDTLNGGLGNDTLIGGSGSDSIRFDTLLNALSNRDTISDFDVAADSIELENVIFTSLNSTGTLAAGSFRSAAGVSACRRQRLHPLRQRLGSAALRCRRQRCRSGGAVRQPEQRPGAD